MIDTEAGFEAVGGVFVGPGFTPALQTTACRGGSAPRSSRCPSSVVNARIDGREARSRDMASTCPGMPAPLANWSTASQARILSRQASTMCQCVPPGDRSIASAQAKPRPVLPPVMTTVRAPVAVVPLNG
jgi:hypothetical protein